MSGGSPLSVRQRHSVGEAPGGGDDDVLDSEDDASSKPPPGSPPAPRRGRTWGEVGLILIWVLSACFVIYFGDGRSNLAVILWSDGRIRRSVFYVGVASIVLNLGFILYATVVSWGPKSCDDKEEALLSTAPSAILLGSVSFCLISFALWPVWGYLTILLLITLFMSTIVTLSGLMNTPLRSEFLRNE